MFLITIRFCVIIADMSMENIYQCFSIVCVLSMLVIHIIVIVYKYIIIVGG